jgi:xanthine dehydrogenase accessory factor
MPEVDVWRALAGALEAGTRCALLAVVDSRGSSPGRRGAVMAVGPGGPLAGTIGGGAAEAGLVDRVSADLRAGTLAITRVPLEHRAGAAEASGMVCGGSQLVLVAPLDQDDRAGVSTLVGILAAGRQATWSIDPDGWRVVVEGPGTPAPDPMARGQLAPGAPGESAAAGQVAPGPHSGTPREPEWPVVLCSGPTHVAHVIGAGHVGSALAPLLVALDFRVVLLDERPKLVEAAAPPVAHELVTVPYEELARAVEPGPRSFAAIMTHDHTRDAVALSAVEPLQLGYLGLLGSRAKVRRIVGERPMPAWFHAPMGVPIGSATPAEIAVSIAAEMVAARSDARRSLSS